ncbi:MAG: hypothetical protein OXH65_03730 [Paracoccaceae bacterium]|nr:hypothetical protein [Paracoccaceae bacterium]
MARTIQQLEEMRASLLDALDGNSVAYARDSNGEAVNYRTPQEINQALTRIESELANARKTRNPIQPRLSRGL